MDSAILRRNLTALALHNPSLVRRLCEPVGNDHVEFFRSLSGELTARFTRSRMLIQSYENPVKEASEAVEAFTQSVGSNVFCLGVGLGYELSIMARKVPKGEQIVAYERDPWLLRCALCLHDFTRDILTRKLQFLLSTDLVSWWHRRTENYSIFFHPWLGKVYGSDWDHVHKNAASERRILVARGDLFVDDVVDSLEHLGCRVWLWDPRKVSLEEGRHEIKTFDPQAVFSINFMPGLADLCETLGVGYIVWEIDPTVECLKPRKAPSLLTKIFTYRKARIRHFRESGYKSVEYLPLATNPRRRRPVNLAPEELRRYGTILAFVGSSMKAQEKALGRLVEKTCALRGINPKSAPYVDKPVPGPDGRLLNLSLCAAEKTAGAHRQRIVWEILSLPFACKIWGDPGWNEVCPPSVYQGPAEHGHELTAIYNASWINLDIVRTYQNDIVTMRVFDVLACKAFILAEYASDMGELFDVGRELIVYRTSDELKKLIRHFVQNHEERAAVAKAGYERVLKDHTMDHRMAWVLQNV